MRAQHVIEKHIRLTLLTRRQGQDERIERALRRSDLLHEFR